MNQAEYARHRGVVKQTVNQAVREGRISLTRTGRINVAAADLAWEKSRDLNRGGDRRTPEQIAARLALKAASPSPRSRRGRAPTPAAASPSDDANVDPGRNGEAESATKSRVAAQVGRIEWQTKLSELQFKRESGELLDRAEVLKAIDDVMRAVRDQLLGVPARISSTVAALSIPAEAEKVMTDEIRLALDELSRIGAQWKAPA